MMRVWAVWFFLLLSVNGKPLNCPTICRCTTVSSDCRDNQLAELPDNIHAQTEVLDLSYNNFMTIPANLSQFNKLKRLLLKHNQIITLRDNDLSGLTELKELDLSTNSIDRWFEIYKSFLLPAKSLIFLDLSYNSLRGIPLFTSTSLKHLKLTNCSITYINTDFAANLPNLKELDLGGNKLKAITYALENKKLQRVNLTNCGVEEIYANTFSQLPLLKNLSLAHNRNLKSFNAPSRSLQYLDLSDCGLESLPKGNLPSLIELNLYGNRLSKVRSIGFLNMSNVKTIRLTNNAIEEVHQDAFVGLRNVSVIDLSYNVITRLSPVTFVTNINLEKLVLSHNYITELVQFQSKSLTQLDMSNCEISTVNRNSLEKMPTLLKLNLAGNVFTSIPNNFSSKSLQLLDLGLCRITNLRNESLSGMPKLSVLNLAGNRLVEIRRAALHNVVSVRLSDNSWRCDCSSIHLKDLFVWLSKVSSDASSLTCQSPESLEGKSWYEACGEVWFDIYNNKKENAWLYSMVFIIIMFVTFFIMIYFNKSRKKQRERQEQRARELADTRERLCRIQMQEEAQAQRNAPDPRELERPPSYNEAILMAQPMGSCGSIASRKSNSSNKQSKPKTRRKRKKSKPSETQQSSSSQPGEVTDEPNSWSVFLESDV